MNSISAIEKINDPELRQQLSDFINTIENYSGENLKSVILFSASLIDQHQGSKKAHFSATDPGKHYVSY